MDGERDKEQVAAMLRVTRPSTMGVKRDGRRSPRGFFARRRWHKKRSSQWVETRARNALSGAVSRYSSEELLALDDEALRRIAHGACGPVVLAKMRELLRDA